MDAHRVARRLFALAVLGLLALVSVAATPAHAISRAAAERKALEELDVRKGKDPVIVFGQSAPIPAGAVVTESGDDRAAAGNRAGLRTIDAPVVLTNRDEPAYLFHEDRGPFQQFEHPGRVVLVGQDSGDVRVSRELRWIPLVDGEVVPWFRTAGSYERDGFRAFERGVGRGATRAATARRAQVTAAQFDARRRVADALAAERSCALRASDTLGNFFDFGGVDRSRARLGGLFEQLERMNAGFFSMRYSASSKRSVTAELQRMITRRGCKDVFLYLAGSGYRLGSPAVNIGIAPRGAGRVRLQDVRAAAIEDVMKANADVTFKVMIDAPYGGRVADRLLDEPNMAILMTAGGKDEPSYTFVPNLMAGGKVIRNPVNPDQLLEFTNRIVRGIVAFVDSPLEVDHALRERAAGRNPSMMVWLLARGATLGIDGAPGLPATPIVQLGGGFAPSAPPAPPPPPVPLPGPPGGPNVGPSAFNGAVSLAEDESKDFTLQASDPDGDALTYSVIDAPDHGIVSGSGATRTYHPDEDFSGTDRLRFRVSDRGRSAEADVVFTVAAVDDAPVVSTSPGRAEFVEDGAAVRVDDQIDLTDVDSATIDSATVEITGGYVAGQDQLTYTGARRIAGASAGQVLTLSGTATVSEYQAALRQVRFATAGNAPSAAPRTVTFRVGAGSDTRQVAVRPTNDVPVADDGALTTDEDADAPVTLQATDADGDALSYAISDAPDHGTVTGTGTSRTYVPDPNFHGADQFEFTVSDGQGGTDTATISATVNAVEDAARLVTSDGTLAVTENDFAQAVDSLVSLTDVDTDGLSGATVAITAGYVDGEDVLSMAPLGDISAVWTAATGTLTLSGAGTFAQYESALRSVRYVNTSDNPSTAARTVEFSAASASDTKAIALTAVNDAPIAVDGNATTPEDTDRAITLGASDPEGDPLTFTVLSGPAHGALTGTAPALTYAPADDYAGSDTLTFRVSDGTETDDGTFDLTVSPVNDAPTIDLADGATAFVENATPQPVAVDGALDLDDIDSTVLTSATVFIDDGFDAAGDRLRFTDRTLIDGEYVEATGVLTLTGAAGLDEYEQALRSVRFDSVDDTPSLTPRSVVFSADDGTDQSAGAEKAVTVTAANDAPTATDATLPTPEDTNKSLTLAGTDPEGDSLAFAVTDDPDHGTLTGTAPNLVYDPADDFAGTDTFDFTVDDGNGGVDTGTVTMNVTAVNDPATIAITSTELEFFENGGPQQVDPQLVPADVDDSHLEGAEVKVTNGHIASEDRLTFVGASGIGGTFNEATGTLTLTGHALVADYQTVLRSVRYNNASDAPVGGLLRIGFRVDDGDGLGPEEGRIVDVHPENDAPTVSDQDFALDENTAATITLGAVDPDGDTLAYEVLSGPSHGTLGAGGNADQRLYTPTPGYDGPDSFTFRVTDAAGVQRTATVSITVNNVNDAPVLTTTVTPGSTAYAEQATATIIDGGLTVFDDDAGDHIKGAAVQIGGGTSSETLTADTTAVPGGIIAASGGTGGTDLVLTGNATPAEYQAVLRTVRYGNTSDNPPATRTVTFEATDAADAVGEVQRTIAITPENDPPVPAVNAGTTDEDTDLPFQLTATDPDTPAASLTWSKTGDPANGAVTALNANGAGTYDPNLNFAGTDTFTYAVTDGTTSVGGTFTATVTPVNDAPAVALTGGSLPYDEQEAAKAVDGSLGVTDVDDANVESASVAILSPAAGESLSYTGALPAGVSSTGSTATTLTFSGPAAKDDYRDLLRTVEYANTSDHPATARTVRFTVNDGGLPGTADRGIAITRFNDAPVVGVHSMTVGEDSLSGDAANTITLTATDPDGDVVTFSDGAAPANGTRTGTGSQRTYVPDPNYFGSDSFGFSADDGNGGVTPGTVAVTVTGSPDAPSITTTGTALAHDENAAAAIVDSAVGPVDPDGVLAGATIAITGNASAGDELSILPADLPGAITVSGASTATSLVLTGGTTVANYAAALQKVRYRTTSDRPSTLQRTVTFSIDDGTHTAATATRAIDVTPQNDAPAVVLSGSTPSFTEEGSAVVVDGGIDVTDGDDDDLDSARIEIAGGQLSSDTLALDAGAGVSDTNGAADVIEFSGTFTKAAMATVLQGVTFHNSETVDPGGSRTIRFTVHDGDASSAAADKTVAVVNTPDNPIVDATGPLAYTENETPAKTVDDSITVTDNGDVTEAEIAITSGQEAGDDLSWADANGGAAPNLGTDDDSTDVLTLTGTATPAAYADALEAVKYASTNDNPATSKTIAFKASDVDGYGAASNVPVTVTRVNDAPVVSSDPATGTMPYSEQASAPSVNLLLTLTEPEGDLLKRAVVEIPTMVDDDDRLNYADNMGDPIAMDTSIGASGDQRIVLTGTATAAEYLTEMKRVTFSNASDDPVGGNRTIRFTATDVLDATSAPYERIINVVPVDDAPVAVNDTATVDEDANNTTLPVRDNDTDVDAGPKTIESRTLGTHGFVGIDGGGELFYRPDANYCGPDSFTYTLNGGSTATVAVTVTCINDLPAADAESYTTGNNSHAISNTTLAVNDSSDGFDRPAHPHRLVNTPAASDLAGDLLHGDTDVETPNASLVVTGAGTNGMNGATTLGGTVSVEPDGDFIYQPPVGCAGTDDTFLYTVSDGHTPTPGTATAQVTIGRSGCVWYVKNDVADGGGGTSAAPFDTLAEAETASQAGHTVFVDSGDGTTADNDGGSDGYQMSSGERLIGEGEALTVGGVALHPAGTAPVLSTPAGANADVISLDDGNEIRGLTVDPDSNGGGIAGSVEDSGGGTIDDVSIVDTDATPATQPAFELDSTSGTFTISNFTVNAKSTGVRLHNTASATATVITLWEAPGTIALATTGAPALDVDGSTNLANRVVVSGTFDQISVQDSTSGGVNLDKVQGSAVSFGDEADLDLDLETIGGATPAFELKNTGATVHVTAAGSETINATGGPAIDVATTSSAYLAFDSVSSSNSASDGINLDGIQNGPFSATGGTIGGYAGIGFDLNGDDEDVTYGGTFADAPGSEVVEVTGRTGGVTTFSGSIADDDDSGGGIDVNGNSGGQVLFTNGGTKQLNTADQHAVSFTGSPNSTLELQNGNWDIDTTSGQGVRASTNGDTGTLRLSGTGNTVSSGTGTAVSVQNTDLSSNGFRFQSVSTTSSPTQAANGIVLDTTGPNGMTITGTGSDDSGGTINNTSGAAISLANTDNFNADQMNITGADQSGVLGRDVTNFTFTNSTIANAGDDKNNAEHAALAFNYPQDSTPPGAQNNLDGAVTITGNTLTNHYGAGVNVHNYAGTISSANVSSNVISSGVGINNQDDAIALDLFGTGTTAASLTTGTINNNTISGHEGSGIKVQGSQVSHSGSPTGSIGTPNSSNKLVISGNLINGNPGAGAGEGTDDGIGATMTGRGNMHVEITNNGTVAEPLRNLEGHGIFHGVDGNSNGQFLIQGNRIQLIPNLDNVGIRGASASWDIDGPQTLRTPTFKTSITSNHVRNSMGSAIRVLAGGGPENSAGSAQVRVASNDVVGGTDLYAISLENGANDNFPVQHTLCADVTNNTAISSFTSTARAGIVVRARGSTTAPSANLGPTNLVGFSAGTTAAAQTFLTGQNSASSADSSGEKADVFRTGHTIGNCPAF